MSAYLCDDCHLSALAAAVHAADSSFSIKAAFLTLYETNAVALKVKYGDGTSPEFSEQQICSECTRTTFSTIELLKACDCYVYQACEAAYFAGSDAEGLIDMVREHLVAGDAVVFETRRNREDYQAAAWGIDARHGQSEANLIEAATESLAAAIQEDESLETLAAAYVALLNAHVEHVRVSGLIPLRKGFGFTLGPKYARIFQHSGNGDSRYSVAFLGRDRLVRRADSWKKVGRIMGGAASREIALMLAAVELATVPA